MAGWRTDYHLRNPVWTRVDDSPMPIITHTGAGDMVIQAGLVIELSKKYGKVAFPCYPKYWELGKSIYINHPLISLYKIPENHPGNLCSPPEETFSESIKDNGFLKEQEIRLGHYTGEGLWRDFCKGFYVNAGVDYSKRWKNCPIFEAIKHVKQREWPNDNRVFVHQDPSRKLYITRKIHNDSSYFPNFTKNLLEYSHMLMTAEEIHAIDSAFFCLANQLPLIGKLYYHWYARPERESHFRHELKHTWEYVI